MPSNHEPRDVRVADLFCGAGGLSEGFRQAGYRIIAGADVDPDACATYRANFPESTTIWDDLRRRNARARIVEVSKDVEVVVGGPPCQGFSQVRNHARLADDPKNSLYREFLNLLRRIEPRVFVMENVPGMAQMGVTQQVTADLRCGGRYRVRPTLVDAVDFGVPQTRKRIVFIGYHEDLDLEPPALRGITATSALVLARPDELVQRPQALSVPFVRLTPAADPELLNRLIDPWDDGFVPVEQAIGDLAFLEAGSSRADELQFQDLGQPASAFQKSMRDGAGSTITNVGVPRINRDTVLRLSAIPPGGNYLDLPDNLASRYVTGDRWGQDNGSGRLSRKHFYAYRRLHPDIWSWTLNTKADSVYHWSKERALSVREFARLQSFPDRFIVTTDQRKGDLPGRIDGGAIHSRYRQVGNAVPPLLARHIAEAVSEAARKE